MPNTDAITALSDDVRKLFEFLLPILPYGIGLHKIVVDQDNKPIDYIFLDVNKKFEEFTGLKRENILNKKVTEAISGIHDAKPDLISVWGDVALTGKSAEIEFYFEPLKKWYRVFAFSPQKEYFITIFTNETDEVVLKKQLKIAVRALTAISECNDDIIHGQSEQDIFQTVCNSIVKTAGYRLAWVGLALNDGKKNVQPIAQAGYDEGYLETIRITWADTALGRGPTGTSIREKKPNICQNMLTEERFRPWREEAIKRGYASSICLPLLINGDVFSLCIYAQEADAFNEEEVKFLTQLAENVAFGVNAVREKKAHQQSEEKFLTAFRSSPMTLTISGLTDGILIDANPAFEKMTGYSLEEAIGKSAKELDLYPDPAERQHFAQILEKEKRLSNFEFHLKNKSGQLRTISVSSEIIVLGGKECILSTSLDVTEEKKVQKELQDSKNELQAILTSISDGIFTLDKEYRYVYINDQAAIMVGKKSAKDLQGKILWEEFPEAKNTKYYDLYHEAMGKKKIMRFEEYYPPFQKWYQGTIYPNPQGISVFFQDVTERKIAEEKIHKSQIELNEAQRIGHVGSWDWNAQTDKITWSEEYYHIIGLDPKTPPPNYQDHLKQYTEESAKRLDIAVQKALKTGEPYVLDLEQIRPNGTRGWIIARGEAIRDEKGAIIGLRGTAQDITERKTAEEKIRVAGLYNRNLIETSLDPMLTVDANGFITDVNRAMELATGRTRSELIRSSIEQYFTQPQKVTEGLKITLREGTIRDYRVAIKNISGKITDCIWNTTVYKNEKGEVEGVFAAARDISQLLKTEKALQESERKYKAYIDNTYDIIYALDTSGNLTYISQRAKDYGVSPDSLIGKNIDALIFPEDRPMTMRAFQEGLQNKLQQIRVTFRYQTTEGKIFWFEAIGTVQYDEEGNPVSNIGVMRDITERKIAEDRLQELDSVKSRFIRVVSHQLRTPLSAIRWQMENLLGETSHFTELQKEMLKETYRADLEIIATINDLVSALDIEEGQASHLDKTPNSLFSLWESVEVEFVKKCQAKGIKLVTNKPQEPIPLVDMDTEKMRRVLEKLADNALTYTKEGGTIMVFITTSERTVRFEIIDTGIGIPETEKTYIFTRFYRGSNASIMRPDAAGLGLYIAKNFIESHGGTLGFISTEGKGSTFWFEIPLQ